MNIFTEIYLLHAMFRSLAMDPSIHIIIKTCTIEVTKSLKRDNIHNLYLCLQ